MKFGMFLELQARPGVDASVSQAFKREMELAVLAEKLGFDYVWMCEHHSLPERAYCSAPEIFLGALSQLTSRIRLGFAVVELIPQMNHVVRVAERIATLDILSGGRVDVAVGNIGTRQDLAAFGINPAEVPAMVDEGLRLLPRLWMEDSVSHEGKYYHLSNAVVVPKPLQQPHPPLWQATSARSHAEAGRKGLGILTSTTREGYLSIPEYRQALKESKPVGAFVNDQVALLINACCHADDRVALEVGERAELWWWDMLERLHGAPRAPGSFRERLDKGHFLVGGPERCIDIIQKFEEIGVDMIVTWFRYGPTPEESVLEGVKVYAERVIPHFK